MEMFFKILIFLVSLTQQSSFDVELIEQKPVFELEYKILDSAGIGFVLKTPTGERPLDIIHGELSSSNTHLASWTPDNKLIIENLISNETQIEIDLPENFEALSPITWSPKDTQIAFSTTFFENSDHRKTKYCILTLKDEKLDCFNEKIIFHVGAGAYAEPLTWSDDGKKLILLTYPNDHQYQNEYEFTILNNNGEIENVIDIPKVREDEENTAIWPSEFYFSEDGKQVQYVHDEEVKSINIE